MGKRHDIEYVRKEFDVRGLILESTEYINSRTKLQYRCKKRGHRHSMDWRHFQRGVGCKFCNVEKQANAKRFNIDFVREQYYKRKGFKLLSTVYIDSSTKLDYECKNGHRHSMDWDHFQKGVGCPTCDKEKRAADKRMDMAFIREQFDTVKGLILVSTTYINAQTKLDYICKKHEHVGSLTWANFQQGGGCAACSYMEMAIKMSGENSPCWRGGISCDPYCDAWADKEYKKSIKERDGYRCQNPYCSCNGGILCIHHIDFNKKNCNPNNLITVCNSCNSFANKDREWHIAWYQTLMNKKYGYVY